MSYIDWNPNFIKEIKTFLPEYEVTVTFVKKTGEKRVMQCTTDRSVIPEEQHPGEPNPRIKVNTESQPVWDIEKAAWRSFRWDSVIEVRVPFTPESIIIKGPMSE